MEFRQLLRQIRRERGLSQSKLAADCGVSRSYLTRLEKGSRNPPSKPILERIAEALELGEVEQRELFVSAGYSPPQVSSPQIEDALSMLTAVQNILDDPRASDDDIQAIVASINSLRRRRALED